MLDESGNLKPEVARKFALRGGITGAVVWGFFAVLAGVMLVSMGAWAWVVWPFAFYWYANHIGQAVKAYNTIVKPQKWEQNVTFNITNEMTSEEIAKAAERAMNEQSQYAGWAASGYRTEEELQSGR